MNHRPPEFPPVATALEPKAGRADAPGAASVRPPPPALDLFRALPGGACARSVPRAEGVAKCLCHHGESGNRQTQRPRPAAPGLQNRVFGRRVCKEPTHVKCRRQGGPYSERCPIDKRRERRDTRMEARPRTRGGGGRPRQTRALCALRPWPGLPHGEGGPRTLLSHGGPGKSTLRPQRPWPRNHDRSRCRRARGHLQHRTPLRGPRPSPLESRGATGSS